MRAMKILAPTRYELRHHDAPIGVVRAGGIDWISEAANDEAMFWAGWHGLERHVQRTRARDVTPPPAWYLNALRHSASAAAASKTRG